jgi:hypothetical protein
MATGASQNAGLSARVPMLVQTAMKPLMEALQALDPMSEDAIALHKSMSELAKRFGSPSPDMTRADQKLLGERAGGVSPANPAAFAAQIQQQAKNRMGQPAPAVPPQQPAIAGA